MEQKMRYHLMRDVETFIADVSRAASFLLSIIWNFVTLLLCLINLMFKLSNCSALQRVFGWQSAQYCGFGDFFSRFQCTIVQRNLDSSSWCWSWGRSFLVNLEPSHHYRACYRKRTKLRCVLKPTKELAETEESMCSNISNYLSKCFHPSHGQ